MLLKQRNNLQKVCLVTSQVSELIHKLHNYLLGVTSVRSNIFPVQMALPD